MTNLILILALALVVYLIIKAAHDAIVLVFIGGIIAIVHWIAIAFFGIHGAVFSSIVFATIGGIVWFWLSAYGKSASFPFLPAFLKGAIVSFGVMTLASFGFYHLILFYRSGVLNEVAFFTWLAVIVVPPSAYIAFKTIKKALEKSHQERYYINLYFKIFHYNDYPVCVDHVTFKNSTTGLAVTIPVPQGTFYHPDQIAQMETDERIKTYDISLYDETISIPVGTDIIHMVWYSFVEHRCYDDTFRIVLDEHTTFNKHTRETRVKRTKILIRPDASATIIIADALGLPYTKAEFTTPDVGKVHEYHQRFRADDRRVEANDVPAIVQEINASGRLKERAEMLEREYAWYLTIESPGKVVNVTVNDFRYLQYESTYKWFHEPNKKILPSGIHFYARNSNNESYVNLYVNFDKQQLFRLVNSLTNGDATVPVEIFIDIKKFVREDIRVLIRVPGQEVVFEDRTLNVVRYDSVSDV